MALCTQDPEILYHGECAYAVPQKDGTIEVRVYASNNVQHVAAGVTNNAEHAERLCGRLNRYPRQVRQAYGLL